MNIHIKDIASFEAMKMASLAQCQFGSVLYKTNDEFSDVDIHYVYATSVNELNSFLKSHHHLQYKEEGKDHIFVSLHTFLHNLIRGDSTVLFEIVHSDAFKNTPLAFLHDMKDAFINYSIIRSYLGLANRDCKLYYKKETHREQLKTLGHIYRGYYFAKSLIEGNFSLINMDFLKIFTEIKKVTENDFKTKKIYLQKGQELVTNLREILNYRFNNNELGLPKYVTVENQILLDKYINKLICGDNWITKQNYLSNFNLLPFYDVFENGVNYQ